MIQFERGGTINNMKTRAAAADAAGGILYRQGPPELKRDIPVAHARRGAATATCTKGR